MSHPCGGILATWAHSEDLAGMFGNIVLLNNPSVLELQANNNKLIVGHSSSLQDFLVERRFNGLSIMASPSCSEDAKQPITLPPQCWTVGMMNFLWNVLLVLHQDTHLPKEFCLIRIFAQKLLGDNQDVFCVLFDLLNELLLCSCINFGRSVIPGKLHVCPKLSPCCVEQIMSQSCRNGCDCN